MISFKQILKNFLEENKISVDEIYACPHLKSKHYNTLLILSGINLEDYRERRGEEEMEKIKSLLEDLHTKLRPFGEKVEYLLTVETLNFFAEVPLSKTRDDLCKRLLEREGDAYDVFTLLRDHFVDEKKLDFKKTGEYGKTEFNKIVQNFFNKLRDEIPSLGRQASDLSLSLAVDGREMLLVEDCWL